MIAIGMVMGWLGYTTVLYGYCLIKGYDITFGELANPAHVFVWPAKPPMIPANQVTPGGTTAGASNVAGSTTTTATLTAATSGSGGGGGVGDGATASKRPAGIAQRVANSFPIVGPPA